LSSLTVSTASELNAALKSAKSGDVIYLDSGTYSGVSLRNLSVSENVTIISKDLDNPAILKDLNIVNSNGFTFKGLTFSPDEGGQFAFRVSDSQNIKFSNLEVHGSKNGNPQGDSSGISIMKSQNIIVENSEFYELRRGVGVAGSDGVVIEGNNFHDLQTDGVMVSDTSGIRIAGNQFSNFFPIEGDHPDAIQFLTKGTAKSSENIVIENNVMRRGDGDAMQGIFMRDEAGTLPYKNVTITNNLLVGTGYQGISISHGENLNITGNELVSYDGKTNVTWILIKNASGVVSKDNSAIKFGFDNVSGLEQSGDVVNGSVSDNGAAALHGRTGGGDVVVEVPLPNTPEAPLPSEPARPDPGAAPVTGVGDFGSVITGNAGNNVLVGGDGNDTIIDGGGADTMYGGAGDDTYFVNNPGKTQYDVIVEEVDGGIDTVVSSATFTLPANVENLILTGKGGTTGYGNELDNQIAGNQGANILDGGAGNDTIYGGAGNDTIVGRTGNDVLTGGAGDDTFWFQKGDGKDVITDFGANGDHDSLDFSWYYRAGGKPVLTDVGDDLVISFGNGDEITLIGVQASDLTATAKGFII
jgi:Ca2+-binding RTX toxin-like protein